MQTLTVENLPAGTTVPDLVNLFRPFGWVTGVDLKAGAGGATWAVDLAWGADSAARLLDGAVFRGRALAVRGPVAARPYDRRM